MTEMAVTDLAVAEERVRLAGLIDQVRLSSEPISITRQGRRVAVIIDSDAFDGLADTANDIVDRRELEAARADDDYIPWDEVKANLGLG